MKKRRKVSVIGAAMDLGSARRGVDMGPSAIRCAHLSARLDELGFDVEDLANIESEMAENAPVGDASARYLQAILDACALLAKRIEEALGVGSIPLVLGGDHSIAMGSLAGLANAGGPGGVLWIDAHGDLNTPATTPSGNVHGMPLAAALGAADFRVDGIAGPPWVDPSRVALVGVRSLDSGERELIKDMGIAVFTMADIDRRGIGAVMRDALEVVSGDNFVHLSLDVDVCDPEIAPGVGTPVRGGLSYREAHLAMELAADARILTSIEVVEVNPILDQSNMTGMLAVELIASAMGARIL